jgi:hypothetical protein
MFGVHSRIHGMVERLCSTYGSELLPSSSTASSSGNSSSSDSLQQQLGEPSTPQKQQQQQLGGSQLPDVGSAAGVPPSTAVLAAADASAGLPFGVAAETAAAPAAAVAVDILAPVSKQMSGALPPEQQQQQLAFYAFPTLQQLSAATEEALRADGFGYRYEVLFATPAAVEHNLHTQNIQGHCMYTTPAVHA